LEKAHQTLAMNATYIDGFTTPCVWRNFFKGSSAR
jgi:hypothetical protein